MSFDEMISTYISEYRDSARAEMQVFAQQKSSSAAIRRAALCLRMDGKRLTHQRRIPRRVLEVAEARLQAIGKRLLKANDFEVLHEVVVSEIGGIRGIGDLTAYDIAHRIGTYFDKHPQRVHLHAGTKIGARALGISGNSFDPAILPKPFARLTPAEIEDVLCIFKDELSGTAKSNTIGLGCATSRKSHPGRLRVC